MRALLTTSVAVGLFALFLGASPATAAPVSGVGIRDLTASSSIVQEAWCRRWRRCWHGYYSGRRCRVWRRCW